MKRKQMPAMSHAETEILRLLWLLGSGTVQQVCDQLPPHRRKITYATVQTLLRRLEAKGYVTHGTRGKAHVFRPATNRQEVISRTVGDFVQRLFGGDPVPLMLHLADQADLDDKQVRRLKKLLREDGPTTSGERKDD